MNFKTNKVMITNVKLNGTVVWENPTIVYDRMIDETEKKLIESDFKESKNLLKKIMEKK